MAGASTSVGVFFCGASAGFSLGKSSGSEAAIRGGSLRISFGGLEPVSTGRSTSVDVALVGRTDEEGSSSVSSSSCSSWTSTLVGLLSVERDLPFSACATARSVTKTEG